MNVLWRIRLTDSNLSCSVVQRRLELNYETNVIIYSVMYSIIRKKNIIIRYSICSVHIYMYGQHRDRLVLTVKYSQSNLSSMIKLIRLRIYWWNLTVLYRLTYCWLYVHPSWRTVLFDEPSTTYLFFSTELFIRRNFSELGIMHEP
jgi:hypothetical protein